MTESAWMSVPSPARDRAISPSLITEHQQRANETQSLKLGDFILLLTMLLDVSIPFSEALEVCCIKTTRSALPSSAESYEISLPLAEYHKIPKPCSLQDIPQSRSPRALVCEREPGILTKGSRCGCSSCLWQVRAPLYFLPAGRFHNEL